MQRTKSLLVVLFVSLFGFGTAQVPVVLTHAHTGFGFSEATFGQYIDFLADHNYHTITPDQLVDWIVNSEPLPIRPVLYTFDDNYIAMYTTVFPKFQSKGFVGINFAHTNYVGVGGSNDHADWTEINAMETDGAILTESHTMNHLNLGSQSLSTVTAEVQGSKTAIQANIPGKTCKHLAYPYGGYNASVITETQTAGYVSAFTTLTGFNYRTTPLYELRRNGADGVSLASFQEQVGYNLLPPPPPGNGWTIDNTDPNFYANSTTWAASTSTPGFYGTDYQIAAAGTGTKTATWAAYLPQSGTCKVYARWTADPNRATNATYTIHHTSGTTPVVVNQQNNGNTWILLGTFTFSESTAARVVLSDSANGLLVADGVWFEPIASEVADWMLYPY